MKSNTIEKYLERIKTVRDLWPLAIVSDFSKDIERGVIIPLHPQVFRTKDTTYNVVFEVIKKHSELENMEEIAIIYLGAVFNPNKTTFDKVNPSIVFQLQTKEGVDIINYDYVESGEDIVVAPVPSMTKHITDLTDCTLPFIIKDFKNENYPRETSGVAQQNS